jgi:inosose dehydratase
MKVGCFALIDPFSVLDHQLQRIQELGFRYADVTDNTDGGSLGVEFGFAAVASLDANPFDLKRQFERHGLTITSYCAHANLLDPSAPWRYGTSQIIKAVRAAAAIGVKHVITTEGDPKTSFGHNLSEREALFSIREKLYEPLRVAADHGVMILLEPHGRYSDSVSSMEHILELCNSEALGINLDTGNLWVGGGDPLEMVKRLGSHIHHVHWKDMAAEWEPRRGTLYGTGMATIPLGSGVVDIKGTYAALVAAGFAGYSTLEVAGDAAVQASYAYLKALGAE